MSNPFENPVNPFLDEQTSDVPSTVLLTLYCRAIESLSVQPIFKDPEAVSITKRLTPLIEETHKQLVDTVLNGKIDPDLVLRIALRAQKYDQYVRDYLKKYPDAVIVNLGCGLDTRFSRIDNGQLLLFDIDLPNVINYKLKFISPTERYNMIGESVLEDVWLARLKSYANHHFLFLAESLFRHFTNNEVKSLVLKLQQNFPDSELVCELFQKNLLSGFVNLLSQNKLGGRMGMGDETDSQLDIRHGDEFEDWHNGIKLLDEWSFFDTNHPRIGWMRYLRNSDSFRKAQWTAHYHLQ